MAEEAKKEMAHHVPQREARNMKEMNRGLPQIDDDFVKEMLENESREKQEVFSHSLQTLSDATSVTNDSQPARSTYDLSGSLDNDSDSVCCESNLSKQWRGGVQGLSGSNSSSKFDHISSLKMTYYAFKDANVEKTGVPVSMVKDIALSGLFPNMSVLAVLRCEECNNAGMHLNDIPPVLCMDLITQAPLYCVVSKVD